MDQFLLILNAAGLLLGLIGLALAVVFAIRLRHTATKQRLLLLFSAGVMAFIVTLRNLTLLVQYLR